MRQVHTNSYWGAHSALLLIACTWITCDPWFELMFDRFHAGIASPVDAYRDAVAHVGQIRSIVFIVFVSFNVCLLLATLARMLKQSPKRHRSVKSWLILTTVIASWCGLVLNVPSITWQGKRIQFASRINQLESLASPLRTNWPKSDGELAGVGPFMAYPIGNPSTLVLLTPPSLSGNSLFISAVNRDITGSIRFELGGIHAGDFVEWHRAGLSPKSFTCGLSEHRELESSVSLGASWYLARYRP